MTNIHEWNEGHFNLPTTEEVFVVDGIHGQALCHWSDRDHRFNFKHYTVCWWEATPYPMSIARWRVPKQPIAFGYPADLYEGPAFNSIP